MTYWIVIFGQKLSIPSFRKVFACCDVSPEECWSIKLSMIDGQNRRPRWRRWLARSLECTLLGATRSAWVALRNNHSNVLVFGHFHLLCTRVSGISMRVWLEAVVLLAKLTVWTYGNVQPFIRSYGSTTTTTTSCWRLISVCTWVPWCWPVDALDRLLCSGEGC